MTTFPPLETATTCSACNGRGEVETGGNYPGSPDPRVECCEACHGEGIGCRWCSGPVGLCDCADYAGADREHDFTLTEEAV